MADLGSILCKPLVVAWTTLQSLWAVSVQPTLVLSLGLHKDNIVWFHLDDVTSKSVRVKPWFAGAGGRGKWRVTV